MHKVKFISQRITRSSAISIKGKIEKVFPLFGAFEERKWADGWNPTLIYPSEETMEEGTTFSTQGTIKQESEFLWRVSKYEPTHCLVQYLVSTENRYWTITVKCDKSGDDTTVADITYTYIGLNDLGNRINLQSLEKMYVQNLKDWEQAINYYLKTGKVWKEV